MSAHRQQYVSFTRDLVSEHHLDALGKKEKRVTEGKPQGATPGLPCRDQLLARDKRFPRYGPTYGCLDTSVGMRTSGAFERISFNGKSGGSSNPYAIRREKNWSMRKGSRQFPTTTSWFDRCTVRTRNKATRWSCCLRNA